MKRELEYVWYAAYGSNINKERFYCYIEGGRPNGTNKDYVGCSNKTTPRDEGEIFIKSEIYFANKSGTWNNGGVAFLKNDFKDESKTLGRMYLIRKDQFIDVVKQENGQHSIKIDFDYSIETGGYTFLETPWYGKIIYLGNQHSYPIFTITNAKDLDSNKPDKAYLKTIAIGLKQVFPQTNQELRDYFLNMDGVKENYTADEILTLFSQNT